MFDTQEARVWGPEEKKKLLQGIETYGIGNWDSMKKNLLPAWVSFVYLAQIFFSF